MKTAPRPRAWPLSAIEGRRPAVAGGRYRRRRPRYRRPAERWSFVSPDAVAVTHGAVIGYVWKGGWLPRLDWDAVMVVVQYLLGYQWRGNPYTLNPPLRRAFQHVAMAWPPPASVKTAVLAIIDHWSNDTALDDPSKAAAATRRLQRARAILEEWSQRRETP